MDKSARVIGYYFKEHEPNSLPKLYLLYALTGAPGAAPERRHKGREVVGEFVVSRQDWENLRVGTVQKFDRMRESTIASVLVNSQEPNDGRQQDNRRLDEEIALLLHPTFVQIEHDGVGCFIGVGDVCHKVRMDRIATVRSAWIVEVDDEKLRLDGVRIEVLAQMIVGNLG